MQAMPELNEFVTITEAVEMADGRYTRRYINKVANGGGFDGAFRIGRLWMIPRSSLLEWLNTERRPGPKSDE